METLPSSSTLRSVPDRWISFSEQDLKDFSAASGDRNPLHLSAEYARATPYGQPVVFGALGAIACLGNVPVSDRARITKLEAQFLRPAFIGVGYTVVIKTSSGTETRVSLYDGSTEVQRLSVHLLPHDSGMQAAHYPSHFEHSSAVLRQESEIAPGLAVNGIYACDPAALQTVALRWELSAAHAFALRSLCWSSYLVGMELPGETALFSKALFHFELAPSSRAPGEYSASVEALDSRVGQARISAELAVGDSQVVKAEMWSFVRPQLPAADGAVSDGPSETLEGKIALVIGASRGLGAAIKHALELRGAVVYSLSRSPGDANSDTGDAADIALLQQVRSRILRQHGRLDILVCNAFPALLPLRLEPNAFSRIEKFLNHSIAMVSAPLCAFMETLEASQGGVVVISSSAVENPVREWPHYIAAKQAVEGLSAVAALQFPKVKVLTIRPEKLLTAFTNTPMGRRGASPPSLLASEIADTLAKYFQPLDSNRKL